MRLAPLALAVVIAVPAMTHEAPLGEFNAPLGVDQVDRSSQPVNTYRWTDALAEEFPGCVENTGILTPEVVVQYPSGYTVRMDITPALADNEGNYWIVGACDE